MSEINSIKNNIINQIIVIKECGLISYDIQELITSCMVLNKHKNDDNLTNIIELLEESLEFVYFDNFKTMQIIDKLIKLIK